MSDALRDRELLLVLDNFEQVVEATTLVAGILASTPITILVTSREVLRLSAERVIVVQPLTLPAADLAVEEMVEADAVRLFIDRARAARSDFALTAASTPAVVEILARLDGLPLAIELAAARMAHMAPASLLARLDRRLPLLTGGPRDLPARQRTLRDAIAWSHDLLGAEEQLLFRRLAVFVGGLTLEAAEAVCRAIDAQPVDVLDGIASLVARSLLQAEADAGGALRYRMLETIREYALERLEVAGEVGPTRDAHAAWFLMLAGQRQDEVLLLDHDQSQLDVEHANLRAALAWLEETGNGEQFVRLAADLGQFWSGPGNYEEGQRWLMRAQRASGAMAPDRGRALVALGIIRIYLGSPGQAEADLVEGLALCRAVGADFDAARALIGLGALATIRADFARGTACLEECLVIARTLDDRRHGEVVAAWAAINLAVIARARGDHALAEEYLVGGLPRHARRGLSARDHHVAR